MGKKKTADKESAWIITKLERYKDSLLEKEESLKEELSLQQKSGPDTDLGEYQDIELEVYQNPQETYLITQIRISNLLPPVLDQHIHCIKGGSDLDQVVESLEWEIYLIKKKVYANIKEWENLLNYLSDYRILEIENNPKGPGDLLIKDLIWMKEYESKSREELDNS